MGRETTTPLIERESPVGAAAPQAPGQAIGPNGRGGEEPARLSAWERISFGFVHGVLALILALTSLETLYGLGKAFGTLEWAINFRRRRRFHRALDGVLDRPMSQSERRREARRHFVQTRCDKIFYLIFDCIPRDKARALFAITNRHLIDDAVARGRGVYVALSHHGAHHVAAMLMASLGYRVAGVRDRGEGSLRRYVQARFDQRFPDFQRMKVIFADAYPREIYRCFQEGYVLGSAMDVARVRHPNQRVEYLEVFGRRHPFVSGPLRVAERCGAVVLQGFIVAHEGFRYELTLSEIPMNSMDGKGREGAILGALEAYARAIERFVREHPSLMTRLGR